MPLRPATLLNDVNDAAKRATKFCFKARAFYLDFLNEFERNARAPDAALRGEAPRRLDPPRLPA